MIKHSATKKSVYIERNTHTRTHTPTYTYIILIHHPNFHELSFYLSSGVFYYNELY